MKISWPLFLFPVMILVLGTGNVQGSDDLHFSIEVDPVYDRSDLNEWGPGPGGEEILPEWGEPVVIRALPENPLDRSVIYIWNITNLHSMETTVHQGRTIEVIFIPSTRILDGPLMEKFLVALTVHYIRSSELAGSTSIQFWVTSDDDDDNDGLPDRRESYYWKDGIIHHNSTSDEDRDGWTNMQEIGFDIPLSYSEKLNPYRPPIGHFDPTDPASPGNTTIEPWTNRTAGPSGPVLPRWGIYLLLGGIISPAVAIVIVDYIYIRYHYIEPRKKWRDSFLEKGRKDGALTLLDVLEHRSVG